MDELSDFNDDAYDYIMFVVKDSIDVKAYAYINWKLSVFQDLWAIRPSALIHELAHNLGYLHSVTDEFDTNPEAQYSDKSGLMGYSQYDDECPKICFNAAKSWFFGWYSSLHTHINPLKVAGNRNLNLIGVNDFLNSESSSTHTTIVRIYGGEPLFMMYNKKEGVNNGTV